jgi:hypothetical protein
VLKILSNLAERSACRKSPTLVRQVLGPNRQGSLRGRQMLVAGSGRSFPHDSRSSYQFYEVKRMIRGIWIETILTYSQTLNM